MVFKLTQYIVTLKKYGLILAGNSRFFQTKFIFTAIVPGFLLAIIVASDFPVISVVMTEPGLMQKFAPRAAGGGLAVQARLLHLRGILQLVREAVRGKAGLTARMLRLVEDIAAEERQEQRFVFILFAAERQYRRDKAQGRLRRLAASALAQPDGKFRDLKHKLLFAWYFLSRQPTADQ